MWPKSHCENCNTKKCDQHLVISLIIYQSLSVPYQYLSVINKTLSVVLAWVPRNWVKTLLQLGTRGPYNKSEVVGKVPLLEELGEMK